MYPRSYPQSYPCPPPPPGGTREATSRDGSLVTSEHGDSPVPAQICLTETVPAGVWEPNWWGVDVASIPALVCFQRKAKKRDMQP